MAIVLETANVIVGTAVIILNLVPFIMKKPKYLLLTGLVSLLMLFLLLFLKQ